MALTKANAAYKAAVVIYTDEMMGMFENLRQRLAELAEFLHYRRQVVSRTPNDEVVMVAHQHKTVDLHTQFLNEMFQQRQKRQAVSIGLEDRPPPCSAVEDVIPVPLGMLTEFSCHSAHGRHPV